MLRTLFIVFIALVVSLLVLQGRTMQVKSEMPIFLRSDVIAQSHHTNIDIKVRCLFPPAESEVEMLKSDYSNLWAHLNHLYATNDVEAGKRILYRELV